MMHCTAPHRGDIASGGVVWKAYGIAVAVNFSSINNERLAGIAIGHTLAWSVAKAEQNAESRLLYTENVHSSSGTAGSVKQKAQSNKYTVSINYHR